MHLITLAETYPEHFKKLEGWLGSVELENGKSWNIKPREIKLYDLVIPKEAEKEVLSLLKPLNHRRHTQILQKVIRYISKVFKKIKPINNEVEPTPFKELGWWAYATPIGILEDDELNGKEAI